LRSGASKQATGGFCSGIYVFFFSTADASVSKEMKDAAIDAARKSRESGFQEEQPWEGWF
jgi:hypothetical protein